MYVEEGRGSDKKWGNRTIPQVAKPTVTETGESLCTGANRTQNVGGLGRGGRERSNVYTIELHWLETHQPLRQGDTNLSIWLWIRAGELARAGHLPCSFQAWVRISLDQGWVKRRKGAWGKTLKSEQNKNVLKVQRKSRQTPECYLLQDLKEKTWKLFCNFSKMHENVVFIKQKQE